MGLQAFFLSHLVNSKNFHILLLLDWPFEEPAPRSYSRRIETNDSVWITDCTFISISSSTDRGAVAISKGPALKIHFLVFAQQYTLTLHRTI